MKNKTYLFENAPHQLWEPDPENLRGWIGSRVTLGAGGQ